METGTENAENQNFNEETKINRPWKTTFYPK